MSSPPVRLLHRVTYDFYTYLGDRQGSKHSSASMEDNRIIDGFNEYFKKLQSRFKISSVSLVLPQPAKDQPVEVPTPITPDLDSPQQSQENVSMDDMFEGVEGKAPTGKEDEDDGEALFNWDEWIDWDNVVGLGFSDEEQGEAFEDDEPESDLGS
ncbi:hypothetical protein FRC12_010645 [Ceratobasidium sp. 428]|nr:hypothetical protein FRC12_010645 [Ceratobasidium sp. 428]